MRSAPAKSNTNSRGPKAGSPPASANDGEPVPQQGSPSPSPKAPKRAAITAERARELLDYDPITGVLRRLRARDGKWCEVTTLNKDGYLCLHLDQKIYIAHRVIFLVITGRWPIPTIDHINRIKTDNRWTNLREATRRENNENRTPNQPREHTGAYKMVNTGRYEARGTVNGKSKKFGTYDTAEEASAAVRRRYAGMSQ